MHERLLGCGRNAAVDAGAVVAGAFIATAAMVAAAAAIYGRFDIFSPTVDQLLDMRRPEQIARWHSTSWSWAQRATYLVVPPVVVACWLVLHRGEQWRRKAEFGLVLATLAQFVCFAWLQADGGSTLEYYFYSSMLWSLVPVATALVFVRISQSLSTGPAKSIPVVILVATAATASLLPIARFPLWPTALAVGLGLVLVVWLMAVTRFHSRSAVVATVLVAVFAATTTVLTIGQPYVGYRPGQVTYPQVDYAGVFDSWTAARTQQDVYHIISAVPAVVSAAALPGAPVRVWYRATPPDGVNVVSRAAAQYLWNRNTVGTEMPKLAPDAASRLDSGSASYVLLLGETDTDFDAARSVLAPWNPVVVATESQHAGVVRLAIRVRAKNQQPHGNHDEPHESTSQHFRFHPARFRTRPQLYQMFLRCPPLACRSPG